MLNNVLSRFLLVIVLNLLLFAIFYYFFTRKDRKRRAENNRSQRAREYFAALPLEKRGVLCFSLEAEPHTLIIARLPCDIPESVPLKIQYESIVTPEQACKFINGNPDIWILRFLHSDASISTLQIRRAGRLIKDRMSTSDDIANMFVKEKDITRLRVTTKGIFDEKNGVFPIS